MDGQRQQQELEQERMAHNLEALERIAQAGLPEIAKDLASELGLSEQFNRERRKQCREFGPPNA